ncbi:hypothetical protein ABZ949_02225 [Micromonospora tulbaghiae]|uniref:hypothetical protein n=1 Tax=Micromonospora tulbaghiae TaxID=479978 RepID=UPI0033FEF031
MPATLTHPTIATSTHRSDYTDAYGWQIDTITITASLDGASFSAAVCGWDEAEGEHVTTTFTSLAEVAEFDAGLADIVNDLLAELAA